MDRLLEEHYVSAWGRAVQILLPDDAHRPQLPDAYRVIEFPPAGKRREWIYATEGMSIGTARAPRLELHLWANSETPRHAEILHVIAHYHLHGRPLGLHHTVYLGQPWVPGSKCTHAYTSIPYLSGPTLEWFMDKNGAAHRCLWLVPITPEECKLASAQGAESLERAFERASLDYANPFRASTV